MRRMEGAIAATEGRSNGGLGTREEEQTVDFGCRWAAGRRSVGRQSKLRKTYRS